MTKAEYDALLAAVLKVGVIETIEMCDCDTWDCECDGAARADIRAEA